MKKQFALILALFISIHTSGQINSLKTPIEKIIKHKKAIVGVALCDLSNGDTLTINGDYRFPMQSIFKFPIALALLRDIDQQKYKLEQKIAVNQSMLHPNTWSPLKKDYPNGGHIAISEIIKYTIIQSDNNGCDIILDLIGGTQYANNYIKNLGLLDINIINTEQELHSSWNKQFNNWTTPIAMINLLKKFNNKELLKPETHEFLWKIMAQTSTGSIREKLPKNAIVIHKTGLSDCNSDGITAANNDIGILILPNGKRIAFTILITQSAETQKDNYAIIANIAEVLYSTKLTPDSSVTQ